MMKKVLILGLLVALCMMAAPAMGAKPQDTGPSGTTITVDLETSPFWTQTWEYDWEVEKLADPSSISIEEGDTGEIDYQINVRRSEPTITDEYGVRGNITVTNGGSLATENLNITDIVFFNPGGGFQICASVIVDLSSKPILNPGESYEYPYEVTFTPVPGATYRNDAEVSITNHNGHVGEVFVKAGRDDFSISLEPTSIIKIDETAEIEDAIDCPDGFTWEFAAPGVSWPRSVSNSGSIPYTVRVTNVNAPCDSSFDFNNTANLTENNTEVVRTAEATVDIYTGTCSTGCTYTIGYWKNHAGFGPQDDVVTPLLPQLLGAIDGTKTMTVTDAGTAVDILKKNVYGDSSNGITKLYAQLLAAKLNIENGADGSAVAQTIEDSDGFLAETDSASWSSLSKGTQNSVNSWMTTLDQYNNGLIGPGHCTDDIYNEE